MNVHCVHSFNERFALYASMFPLESLLLRIHTHTVAINKMGEMKKNEDGKEEAVQVFRFYRGM